jgi:hypothetical protein
MDVPQALIRSSRFFNLAASSQPEIEKRYSGLKIASPRYRTICASVAAEVHRKNCQNTFDLAREGGQLKRSTLGGNVWLPLSRDRSDHPNLISRPVAA